MMANLSAFPKDTKVRRGLQFTCGALGLCYLPKDHTDGFFIYKKKWGIELLIPAILIPAAFTLAIRTALKCHLNQLRCCRTHDIKLTSIYMGCKASFLSAH